MAHPTSNINSEKTGVKKAKKLLTFKRTLFVANFFSFLLKSYS